MEGVLDPGHKRSLVYEGKEVSLAVDIHRPLGSRDDLVPTAVRSQSVLPSFGIGLEQAPASVRDSDRSGTVFEGDCEEEAFDTPVTCPVALQNLQYSALTCLVVQDQPEGCESFLDSCSGDWFKALNLSATLGQHVGLIIPLHGFGPSNRYYSGGKGYACDALRAFPGLYEGLRGAFKAPFGALAHLQEGRPGQAQALYCQAVLLKNTNGVLLDRPVTVHVYGVVAATKENVESEYQDLALDAAHRDVGQALRHFSLNFPGTLFMGPWSQGMGGVRLCHVKQIVSHACLTGGKMALKLVFKGYSQKKEFDSASFIKAATWVGTLLPGALAEPQCSPAVPSESGTLSSNILMIMCAEL
eukprot:2717318-Amphidinium_carterae.1